MNYAGLPQNETQTDGSAPVDEGVDLLDVPNILDVPDIFAGTHNAA